MLAIIQKSNNESRALRFCCFRARGYISRRSFQLFQVVPCICVQSYNLSTILQNKFEKSFIKNCKQVNKAVFAFFVVVRLSIINNCIYIVHMCACACVCVYVEAQTKAAQKKIGAKKYFEKSC